MAEAVKNCFLRFGQRNCLFPEGPQYSKLRCLKCHVQHYLYISFLSCSSGISKFMNKWQLSTWSPGGPPGVWHFSLLRRRCRFSCRLQVRLWCWRSWLQPWKDDFGCSRCSSDVQILISIILNHLTRQNRLKSVYTRQTKGEIEGSLGNIRESWMRSCVA